MIKIRNIVFETNSSSTHSIVIPRKIDGTEIPYSHVFSFGEFGGEEEEVDPCDYLYTAIYACDKSKIDERLTKLRNCLSRHHIMYTFSKPKPAWWKDGRVYEADESYIRGYNAGLKSAWHTLMTLTEYFGNQPTPTNEFPTPDDILETIKKIDDESEGLPEKFC